MKEIEGTDADETEEGLGSLGPQFSNQNNVRVDRKPISYQGRVTGPARKSSKGKWTQEEDKKLEDAVRRFGGKNWKGVAECVPGRTDVQCLHRWQKVLDPELVKGPWKKEEDDRIIELVEKQGNNKQWSKIAKHLPGRIGKQCRERWHNHLNPGINKAAWTTEEELALINAHKTYGNKWAEISKYLKGRTENSIKNHWNCSLKRRLEHFTIKTEPQAENLSVAKQGLSTIFPLDPNPDSETNDEGPCLDLLLGNPSQRETNSPKALGGREHEITKMPISPSADSPDTSLRIGNPSYESQSSSCSLPTQSGENESYRNFVDSNVRGENENDWNFVNCNVRGENEICRNFVDSNVSGENENDWNFVNCNVRGENEICRNFVDSNVSGLCYEPLQEKDLKVLLSTGEFPKTDDYIPVLRTSVSYGAPAVVSPESIFKTMAMSYKNVPSIMRKKRAQESEKVCDSSKEGQILVSPCKSRRIEESDTLKSVEKRLESAFDDAWDRPGNADVSVLDARGSSSGSVDSGDSRVDRSNGGS